MPSAGAASLLMGVSKFLLLLFSFVWPSSHLWRRALRRRRIFLSKLAGGDKGCRLDVVGSDSEKNGSCECESRVEPVIACSAREAARSEFFAERGTAEASLCMVAGIVVVVVVVGRAQNGYDSAGWNGGDRSIMTIISCFPSRFSVVFSRAIRVAGDGC